MDKNSQEYKKLLEEQLEWCKERDCILEKIESKFYEMKRIAEYALKHDLTSEEIDGLNGQLNELQSEVHSLEKQLQSVVH
jgi:hypothetical protein